MQTWFLEQMAMYSAYHRDPKTQLTHHVGVPVIVYALLVALSHWQIGVAGTAFPVTGAMLLLAGLLVFYMLADPMLGVLAAGLYVPLLWVAHVTTYVSLVNVPSFAWMVAGACFAGGWIIQLTGHAVFEHRRPALADNVLQIFTAPVFVIAEILFAFGLRQELKAGIAARMDKYLPKAA